MTARTDTVVCHLRSVRQAKRVSQSQLADSVGVKRQAIYDIESGRYLPNTALALKLARHLGCRVEDLFVDRLNEPEQPIQLVDSADRGIRRVVVCKLRGRLLAYPLAGEHSFRNGLRPADGLLDPDSGKVRFLSTEEAIEKSVVLMGCDPAFSILSEHIARRAPEARVYCRFASSHRALEAVYDGRAHLAGTHLHNIGDKEANVELAKRFFGGSGALIIGFSLMEEGLMVAPNNPYSIRSVADLAGEKIRMVNREPGAALRVLLDEHLERSGIPKQAIRGYDRETASHLEGARMVAHGLADVALGLRVVADACGLDFVTIESVRCDLVVPRDQVDHYVVKILLDTLQTRLFHEELASISGYENSRTGDMIAKA
jgi:putative molybdopterin biosynthesis protein